MTTHIFARTVIGSTKTEAVTVNEVGGASLSSPVVSTDSVFTGTVTSLFEVFPASSNIYFGDKGQVQDANGDFYTTDQGFGKALTTDAGVNPLGTVVTNTPSVSITSPADGAKYEVDASVTVTWSSSNIANLDLVVESATGLLEVNDIVASLGTYTFNLTAGTGSFAVNDAISISLTDCIGVASDTINISSIATISMATPTGVIEGVNYDFEIDSNGDEVELFYKLSSGSSWTSIGTSVITGGSCIITGSVPTADTYDFEVLDTTDPDGSFRVNNITVASGEVILIDWGGYTDGTLPNPPVVAYTSSSPSIYFTYLKAGYYYAIRSTTIEFSSTVDFSGKTLRFILRHYGTQALAHFSVALTDASNNVVWNKTWDASTLLHNTWYDLQEAISSGANIKKMVVSAQQYDSIPYFLLIGKISKL